MDFGLVAQTNPPAKSVVELAKRAEDAGFTHFWTFDSCVLWQEPFVIYSQILANTSRIKVGPMVTNPDHSRLDRDGVALCHLERDVRAAHDLRHRPRRLGAARDGGHAGVARRRSRRA